MKLSKAIEIKLQWLKDNYPAPLADEINADNLSIEALHRIQAIRILFPTLMPTLLPGEDPE